MTQKLFKSLAFTGLITANAFCSMNVQAQSELYPQHFNLEQVCLLDGPFRTSLITNAKLLLQYDADRLMTPFIREAGLSKTTDKNSKYYNWTSLHPSFSNWGLSDWSLEGHVGGHYLSALALTYASLSADADQEQLASEVKNRLDYCLNILKDCQDAYKGNTEGMEGFLGGQPITQIWRGLYANNLSEFKRYGGWVPFYCQHKVLAGLRDAYIYADSELAKEMFRGLADWSVNVVSKLSTADMQTVLGWEHGGMNETLADAYAIFGDSKYLTAAKKYSHATMVDGMQSLNTTFLDNKHANTQVPKYIGFERIYQEDKTATTYKTAARNFWKDVADNRTVCIGGNSVDEHFLAAGNSSRYINVLNGPETCNTNNMLKLSEDLFDDTHSATYADFYESSMYNHILSTQDPETGGYVYFTTLRPQGYKIYSQVNQGMWCCVGTGMENHSKYSHFIYTHSDLTKTLYVNLFTASTLTDSVYSLTQTTRFPYEEKTLLTINKAGEYTIAVRHPSWAGADFAISINGEPQSVSVHQGTASYVKLKREWKENDQVEVKLPMSLRIEECPNLSEYIAIKYGPILLAAKTSTSDLQNEYAGEGRMDHAPGSRANSLSVVSSPLLICERDSVLGKIKKTGDLTFDFNVARSDAATDWSTLQLQPFFSTHHARYMIYWYQQTAEQYAESSFASEEAKKLALTARTIDYVGTGEQQSEVGHKAEYSANSTYGSYNGEIYRDVQSGGYIQYVLANNDETASDLSIMCRFTTDDAGRVCTIYIDGTSIGTYTIPSTYPSSSNGFFDYELPIPDKLLFDSDGKVKKEFTFRIEASGSTPVPGIYYLRLLKDYSKQFTTNYQFVAREWATTGDAGRVTQGNISYDADKNTVTVKSMGTNNVCLNFTQDKYNINSADKYFLICASNVSAADGDSFLWWFNGTNHGTSVKPTHIEALTDGDNVFYWDLTTSGLDDNSTGKAYSFSLGNTIFGLTSTTGTSEIKYIGFNSEMAVPTGIESIASDKAPVKGIYSLSGSKLQSTEKGINILDGRKVLVR